MANRPKVEGLIIEGKYQVGNYITSGAFGAIYVGTNLKTKDHLAIKLEAKDTVEPTLPLEFHFYTMIGKRAGVPEVYHFGPCGTDHNAIVMEMLGTTLEKMHTLCGNKLSADTTAKVGLQILSVIEFIHSKGIIFRDTKPENFLLGPKDSPKANIIHMIDFGLANSYLNKNGRHIREKKCGGRLFGTRRYMSTWSHLGKEQSCRDDLESIGFMLVYLVKGTVPWIGVKAPNRQKGVERIGKIKCETPLETLCEGFPNSS